MYKERCQCRFDYKNIKFAISSYSLGKVFANLSTAITVAKISADNSLIYFARGSFSYEISKKIVSGLELALLLK